MSFSILPPEIKKHIFSFLDKPAKTQMRACDTTSYDLLYKPQPSIGACPDIADFIFNSVYAKLDFFTGLKQGKVSWCVFPIHYLSFAFLPTLNQLTNSAEKAFKAFLNFFRGILGTSEEWKLLKVNCTKALVHATFSPLVFCAGLLSLYFFVPMYVKSESIKPFPTIQKLCELPGNYIQAALVKILKRFNCEVKDPKILINSILGKLSFITKASLRAEDTKNKILLTDDYGHHWLLKFDMENKEIIIASFFDDPSLPVFSSPQTKDFYSVNRSILTPHQCAYIETWWENTFSTSKEKKDL
jgi:hypothetical protein